MPLDASLGSITFPLTDTGETTLASLNRGRDILLGLLAAALNYELAARWQDATVGTKLAGSTPVADTLPAEADERVLQTTEQRFPLLCCYHSGPGTIEQGPAALMVKRQYMVDYVLSPMSAGTHRKLADVLEAALAVIALTIEAGGHTAYAMDETHTSQYKHVLGPGTDTANFTEVAIRGFQVGVASFASNALKFLALTVTIEATEQASWNGDVSAVDLEAAEFLLGLGTGDDELEDFHETYTDYDAVVP